MEAAKSALEAALADSRQAQEYILRALTLARQSLVEARQAVRAMRSPLLENTDLVSAFRKLAGEMTAGTALAVDILCEGTARRLPAEVEETLLRTGQEALTNALKYAGASHIRLRLAFQPHAVELQVEDNGRGFDTLLISRSEGVGLRGMQERVQRIGGTLTIESRPNAGTKITAMIPLA